MRKTEAVSMTGIDCPPPETDQAVDTTRPDEIRQRILLVDDDSSYLELLAENLAEKGFDVVPHTDSVAAMSWLLNGGRCDAILLDWYMPGIPGRAFLSRVRSAGMMQPVLVLTGARSEDTEDVALGCGAVDFIDKARRFSVLLKRLGIIMDGHKADGDTPGRTKISIGPLMLDSKSSRAYWRGNEAGLTITEFRIVYKLAAQPGIDFTYREIYDVVHGEGFCAGDGEDGVRVNVRSLIKRIRRKFHALDDGFDAIENYPGHGYRWRVEKVGEARPWLPRDEHDDTVPMISACDAAY